MGRCTLERIFGNSHILHHQCWRPVCILQQLSADWRGRVWWHVGTHQRRLHDIFCSLSGGVDNLLHSATFWLRRIHWTLNKINISVEVTVIKTEELHGLKGCVNTPALYSMTFFSVQCIMGILDWFNEILQDHHDEHVQILYISLIEGGSFLRPPPLHFLYVLFPSSHHCHHLWQNTNQYAKQIVQLRLVVVLFIMERYVNINRDFFGFLQDFLLWHEGRFLDCKDDQYSPLLLKSSMHRSGQSWINHTIESLRFSQAMKKMHHTGCIKRLDLGIIDKLSLWNVTTKLSLSQLEKNKNKKRSVKND